MAQKCSKHKSFPLEEVVKLASPQSPTEPSLSPCQLRTLSEMMFDPELISRAFYKWILVDGVKLAAHAMILIEAARVVGELTATTSNGSAAGDDPRKRFRDRFVGDAPQVGFDGEPHFFVCALTAVREVLFVPPCADPLFSGLDGKGYPRIPWMELDLLNFASPTSMAPDAEEAHAHFKATTRFFRETQSVETLLTREAVQKMMSFVSEAWSRCQEEYANQLRQESEAQQTHPPLGARSLRDYFSDVIRFAAARVNGFLDEVCNEP